jgi:hypothetical protein
MKDIGLDIETTGLDPWTSRIVTVATSSNEFMVIDEPDDEEKLLNQLEQYMRQTPISNIVTWNGTEFDLPFIATRMVLNGIDLPPLLKPTGQTGKYGKPRYDGAWYGAGFIDVAYLFEDKCKEDGVSWSLKPAALSYLGISAPSPDFKGKVKGTGPCEHLLDFGGAKHEYDVVYHDFTVLDMTTEERQDYCASDAMLALGLYKYLKPKGQAVLTEGVSIL